jgi:hypothetical protein
MDLFSKLALQPILFGKISKKIPFFGENIQKTQLGSCPFFWGNIENITAAAKYF